MSYNKFEESNDVNLSSDTIKIDKGEVERVLRKRKVFTNNKGFPWLSVIMMLIYICVYVISVYGKSDTIDVDINALNYIKVSNGSEILNGNFLAILTNIFLHRSLWDLVNTLFIIVFCGFFIEKYVKRSVMIFTFILSVIIFNVISIFVFPQNFYLGSFTIMSFLIGMCIYFSYRFKRFVLTIDIYIYIALTFIGFFTSYMVSFYNIFQFIGSYLIGVFVMFVLDTNALREYNYK